MAWIKVSKGGTELGEFAGTPTNVLVTNSNILGTSVTGNPSVFATARLTNSLQPPSAGYSEYFESASPTNAMIKCVAGDTKAYRLDFSGSITAANPAVNDGFLVVKIESSLGIAQVFTGGAKPYPLGPGQGASPSSIGFSITVYGQIADGEVLFLKLSSNNADTLTLTDLITVVTPIKPAG